MKKKMLTTLLSLPLFFTAACQDASDKTSAVSEKLDLESPTNFQFDFNSGAYSFTGTELATQYTISIYKAENNSFEAIPSFMSPRIMKDKTNNSYSGTLEYEFVAGDYRAQLTAFAKGYNSAIVNLEGKSTMLAKPTVSAQFDDPNNQGGGGWPGGGGFPQAITLEDSSTTQEIKIKLTITSNDSVTANYQVKLTNTETGALLYENAAVEAGETILTAADLNGVETITTEDKYTVAVQGNAVEGYTQAGEVTAEVRSGGGGFRPPF